MTDGTIICRHVYSVKKRHGTVAVDTETAEFEGPTIESETQRIEHTLRIHARRYLHLICIGLIVHALLIVFENSMFNFGIIN